MEVAEALSRAHALGIARIDAQHALAALLGQSRSWLVAHGDASLTLAQRIAVEAAFERLAGGVPLAYVLGGQDFHGLTLHVDPRVLIPRSDTEAIVDWALELLAARPRARVVDLGTGSGAIALALKQRCPSAEVVATDVSRDALDVARSNAQRLGLDVSFVGGSWWTALGGRQFELAVSNPPYIPDADPHLPALRDEPTLALTSGRDGLNALREIVDGAAAHLAGAQPWLLLEHGHDQADAVRALLADAGFRDIATRLDAGGRPRCTGGHR